MSKDDVWIYQEPDAGLLNISEEEWGKAELAFQELMSDGKTPPFKISRKELQKKYKQSRDN